ncbi:MAG: aspartate--tRNA ligase [Rhodobacterales bacterium]|nr:aspartate--tRNA ligase [Rhodobacterales bacterium]
MNNKYRTHWCGDLRDTNIGQEVRLSGWLWRARNLGKLLFLDIRDRTGITQCVVEVDQDVAKAAAEIRQQSSVTITGKVVARERVNDNMPTGQIEVQLATIVVQGASAPLPFQMGDDPKTSEAQRLKHRFLDLRRDVMQRNIELRCNVVASIRRRMVEQGFLEIQTPILTASSPEGARDYLVPSRRYPGQFYALPPAPQMFKQLLMVSGFERYFQIAPCFRDEDARADRSPGEFYQLDMEMSFVEQDDVFEAIEPVLEGIFREFSDWESTPAPFPRIPYAESMLKYGSDKPDLRNPLEITDVTEVFVGSGFGFFEKAIEGGAVVRAVPAPKAAGNSRKWFNDVEGQAKKLGAGGMAWIALTEEKLKGSAARFIDDERLAALKEKCGINTGDALCSFCAEPKKAAKYAGGIRNHLGQLLNLLEQGTFKFCWVVDYPFYERDEETGELDFSHNPFSMPQGGMDALDNQDPETILAYQYDIVCNGIELSSGAIRNHMPELMLKAFSKVGYTEDQVKEEFTGMFTAFQYGAPPHGGLAPGVDRMVMLLAHQEDIREVIAFPLNQQAQDLMMGAPSPVKDLQLKELHLGIHWPQDSSED